MLDTAPKHTKMMKLPKPRGFIAASRTGWELCWQETIPGEFSGWFFLPRQFEKPGFPPAALSLIILLLEAAICRAGAVIPFPAIIEDERAMIPEANRQQDPIQLGKSGLIPAIPAPAPLSCNVLHGVIFAFLL